MECSAHRQVLADSTHQNADVIRALGMTARFVTRWSEANQRYLGQNIEIAKVYANSGAIARVVRYALQSAILGIRRLSRDQRTSVGRDHDCILYHDGPRPGADRNCPGQLETTGCSPTRDREASYYPDRCVATSRSRCQRPALN